MEPVITLFRPVGQREFELIAASGFRGFPPGLPEQPIVYPVTNEEYATQIARGWNTRDEASGFTGYVLRFPCRRSFWRGIQCARWEARCIRGTGFRQKRSRSSTATSSE